MVISLDRMFTSISAGYIQSTTNQTAAISLTEPRGSQSTGSSGHCHYLVFYQRALSPCDERGIGHRVRIANGIFTTIDCQARS